MKTALFEKGYPPSTIPVSEAIIANRPQDKAGAVG